MTVFRLDGRVTSLANLYSCRYLARLLANGDRRLRLDGYVPAI